jgi:hypothetical protein
VGLGPTPVVRLERPLAHLRTPQSLRTGPGATTAVDETVRNGHENSGVGRAADDGQPRPVAVKPPHGTARRRAGSNRRGSREPPRSTGSTPTTRRSASEPGHGRDLRIPRPPGLCVGCPQRCVGSRSWSRDGGQQAIVLWCWSRERVTRRCTSSVRCAKACTEAGRANPTVLARHRPQARRDGSPYTTCGQLCGPGGRP